MLVALDIGNSNVVIGIHDQQEWIHIWRIPTVTDPDVNFYKLQIANLWVESRLDPSDVNKVIVSSVVPAVTEAVLDFCKDMFSSPALLAGPPLYDKIELEIIRPREIGSDLVANAYAALRLFSTNALIIDFGTALTFTAVGLDRKLHGVSIAPGIQTAIRSLNTNTARLPEVSLTFPETVGGKDTVHAIQSGVLHGYEGLILHMIEKYRIEFARDLVAIATGGLINTLIPLHQHFEHIAPTLTLDGLRLMADES